jgi:glycosyltransferase involved in cell wall biosynthesis
MGARVLFLETTLAVGGAERQLALLAPRLRDRGFEPFVATLRTRGRHFAELTDAGVPTAFVDMRSRWDARGALRAYRLWKLRPDVIVSHSVDAQVLGQAIAFRAHAPHVTVEHGGVGIARRLHRVLLTRLVARQVERVVAVSESQRTDLRRLWYRDDAVTVIPNGITELRPQRAPDGVRRDVGARNGDVLVVLVAGLRPEKRADVFVDAVSRAHARDARLLGVVVGGGTELAAIESRARTASDRVRVLGERADVADLMAAADAVCLSSDVEGLPMSVLEAMSLSRPVIATDVGGLRDAVVPGTTGWLVPPGDPEAFAAALLELAADPARARSMGSHARRRFEERFTVEEMVDRYAAVLTEVLAGDRLATTRLS